MFICFIYLVHCTDLVRCQLSHAFLACSGKKTIHSTRICVNISLWLSKGETHKPVPVHKPLQRVSYSIFFYRFMFLILALVCLKIQFFLLFSLFCYYLLILLYFFILFMGLTELFQLLFSFIYSNFSKKFSISTK